MVERCNAATFHLFFSRLWSTTLQHVCLQAGQKKRKTRRVEGKRRALTCERGSGGDGRL